MNVLLNFLTIMQSTLCKFSRVLFTTMLQIKFVILSCKLILSQLVTNKRKPGPKLNHCMNMICCRYMSIMLKLKNIMFLVIIISFVMLFRKPSVWKRPESLVLYAGENVSHTITFEYVDVLLVKDYFVEFGFMRETTSQIQYSNF